MNSNNMIEFDKIKYTEYSTINIYNDINNISYIINNSILELIEELKLNDEIDIKIRLDYYIYFIN